MGELALSEDGTLVARVTGRNIYYVRVSLSRGKLESECTCPIHRDCKHGVATILTYLEYEKTGQPVEQITVSEANSFLEEGRPETEISKKDLGDISSYLESQTKSDLVETVKTLLKEHPDIAKEFRDRLSIARGNPETILRKTRKEIKRLSEEISWYNPWEGTGNVPDYEPIRKRLGNLLSQGYADEVFAIGMELIEAGTRQVEESDDDGHVADEISACIPVLVDALEKSSLAPDKKLMKAFDLILEDEYGICNGFSEFFERKHSTEVWNTLADDLILRLSKIKRIEKKQYGDLYKQNQILRMTIRALENSNRGNEILPLCEKQANLTGDYTLLIDLLIQKKKYQSAMEWVQEGLQRTKNNSDSSLRTRLETILSSTKDYNALALYYTEEFVARPTEETFLDCKKSASRIKKWTKVRPHLMEYLETGTYPWDGNDWPLAVSSMKIDRSGPYRRKFPHKDALIEIAILEKDPVQVLKWFDSIKPTDFLFSEFSLSVAESVKDHAPERSLSIWKKEVDSNIARTNNAGYSDAIDSLNKIRELLLKKKRKKEWELYIQDLRTTHVRKRKLMEYLDDFENTPGEKRIVDL